jgi:hypothetical protein
MHYWINSMNITIDDEINSIQTLISLATISSDLPTISLHYYITSLSRRTALCAPAHCPYQRFALYRPGHIEFFRHLLHARPLPWLLCGAKQAMQTRIKHLVPLATCDHPASQPTRFPPPSTSYCPVGGRPVSSSSMITKLYTSSFMLDYIVMQIYQQCRCCHGSCMR